MPSDWAPTLSHRIDEMISTYPALLALKDGLGNSLTYLQMEQRVHSIATSLLTCDVELGSKIAVFQEPTVDWICSLVAILRIGCVYVPLDLRNPLERLSANVQAAQPSAILADSATMSNTSGLHYGSARCIDVSAIRNCLSSHLQPICNRACPKSPAVILFTSGTSKFESHKLSVSLDHQPCWDKVF